MLVYTHSTDERTVIRVPGMAEPIVVAVVLIDRGRVRLAFSAPREVEVNREAIDIDKFPDAKRAPPYTPRE